MYHYISASSSPIRTVASCTPHQYSKVRPNIRTKLRFEECFFSEKLIHEFPTRGQLKQYMFHARR